MPVIRNRRSRVTGCMSAPRIAIVGAGISGLVTAHLLHREHEITVFEAGGTRAGTRTRSAWTPSTPRITSTPASSSSTTATTRTSSGCSAQLGVAAQPSDMSFGGRRRRRLRVQRLVAERAVRQARAPRHAVVSPHGRRPRALQPRRARAAAPRRRGAVARPLARRAAATREPFVERLIVPQASAVWSADPRQMWTFPARFLVEFFANHGMLGFARAAAVARRSRGGSRATSRRSRAVRATGCGSRRRCTAIDALRRPRRGHAARRRARALRRGRARHALRPGAADARRRDRPRARDPRRDPVPAQRGRPAHRRAAAAAPPPRLGELELPPARRADRR